MAITINYSGRREEEGEGLLSQYSPLLDTLLVRVRISLIFSHFHYNVKDKMQDNNVNVKI